MPSRNRLLTKLNANITTCCILKPLVLSRNRLLTNRQLPILKLVYWILFVLHLRRYICRQLAPRRCRRCYLTHVFFPSPPTELYASLPMCRLCTRIAESSGCTSLPYLPRTCESDCARLQHLTIHRRHLLLLRLLSNGLLEKVTGGRMFSEKTQENSEP